jgi:hypothetical protein
MRTGIRWMRTRWPRSAGTVTRSTSSSVAGVAVGEPWAGFEQSGTREIIGHIKALTVADEAVAVASWEEEHGGRQSVMQAAMKRAAELGGGV